MALTFMPCGQWHWCLMGEVDQAEDAVSDAEGWGEDSERLLEARGRIAMAKNQYDAALGAFTQVMSMAPDDKEYLVLRAHAFIAAKRPDEARADLQAALQAGGGSTGARGGGRGNQKPAVVFVKRPRSDLAGAEFSVFRYKIAAFSVFHHLIPPVSRIGRHRPLRAAAGARAPMQALRPTQSDAL